MSTGNAGFPRTQNGYSPQHVDEFIAALAQRAKAQISALEQRVAQLQSASDGSASADLEDRVAKLERLLAERDAQLSEERSRVSMLQRQVTEFEAARVEVVEFDTVEEMAFDGPPVEEPQDWAASVIGRSSYNEWTDEQRLKAAESLRRKRLSACSPAE